MTVIDPLLRGHAHNAYEYQENGTLTALEHGLGSIEGDVWLHTDGRLVVDHFLNDDIPAAGTLRSLYLDPLREWAERHSGRIYPGVDTPLQLLIDLKTCPEEHVLTDCPYSTDRNAVWRAVEAELTPFHDLLSRYEGGRVVEGPVTVVLTGDVPFTGLRDADLRYCFANLTEPNPSVPLDLCPLVNVRFDVGWGSNKRLRSADELADLVRRTHAEGRRLRLWWNKPFGEDPTPEELHAMWETLWTAGVDHISGDDINELAAYLTAKRAAVG
ncbi:hypothetical protein [Streptomyces sp. URMC 123]|uniref:hypothetical protein n=1 Tax=Streptomyces sp. URMC 123 TaxID=3423403 RepID=UPI003F197AF9